MPVYETILPDLNARFTRERIVELAAERFDIVRPLATVLGELVTLSGPAAEFLEQVPRSIQAALLALVKSNLEYARKQMIFTWAPGYDWELNVWETTATPVSEGGITVLLRSRYPGDTRPRS